MSVQKKSLSERWRNSRPTKTAGVLGVRGLVWRDDDRRFLVGRMGARLDGPQHGGGLAAEAGRPAPVANLCRPVPAGSREGSEADGAPRPDVTHGSEGDYVKKQGWATMPGEMEADGKVADECAKLLMLTMK